MTLRERALKAISGEDHSLRGGVLRAALSAASPAYTLGNGLRSAGFSLGFKRAYPLGRPTVSVGNLTTGGTGKTPMVGHVVRGLVDQSHRPCILLRGYRGGDEAEEHRRLLGDTAHVEPNPDRIAGAQLALTADPSITCFVLDDGFQHRRAKRDLDLVLIDATNPWGYGHMLPRGLMREPKIALRRADAVIVTRADQVDHAEVDAIDREVKALTGQAPIAHAEHGWAGLREGEGKAVALSAIAGRAVMGVVGIGNPSAFAKTLAQYAGRVIHCEALPDHYHYTRKALLKLIDLAVTAEADAVVTTEKDWVKWSLLLEDDKVALPIYRADLQLRFRDGQAALWDKIGQAIPKSS